MSWSRTACRSAGASCQAQRPSVANGDVEACGAYLISPDSLARRLRCGPETGTRSSRSYAALLDRGGRRRGPTRGRCLRHRRPRTGRSGDADGVGDACDDCPSSPTRRRQTQAQLHARGQRRRRQLELVPMARGRSTSPTRTRTGPARAVQRGRDRGCTVTAQRHVALNGNLADSTWLRRIAGDLPGGSGDERAVRAVQRADRRGQPGQAQRHARGER